MTVNQHESGQRARYGKLDRHYVWRPSPSGSGGIMLGGIAGAALGGPPGAVLGTLIGLVAGEALERFAPSSSSGPSEAR